MSKKIRLIKRRRICRFRGCEHILSIYNPEAYCYVHQQLGVGRTTPAPMFLSR